MYYVNNGLLFQTAHDATINWTVIIAEYGGLQNYLSKMAVDSTWADGIMIEVAMHYYNRPIIVLYSECER